MKLYFDSFDCKIPSFIYIPDNVRKTTFLLRKYLIMTLQHSLDDLRLGMSLDGPWDIKEQIV